MEIFPKELKNQIEDYFMRIEQDKKKVSSEAYVDWLYNYVCCNKNIDNESALYMDNRIDSENGQLLGRFLDYIEGLAKIQGVPIVSSGEYHFDNESVVIQIKDKYFDLFRMYGQGNWVSVGLLEEEPEHAYVKIENER